MKWFDDYKKLSEEEREYFKEYLCDDEQKIIVLNYERFIASLRDVEQDPVILKKHLNNHLNAAEEVALSFNDEALYISHILYDMKLIDNEVMKMIQQIEDLFDKIDEDKNWSIEYMINDNKWKSIRSLAHKILFMLNEI